MKCSPTCFQKMRQLRKPFHIKLISVFSCRRFQQNLLKFIVPSLGVKYHFYALPMDDYSFALKLTTIQCGSVKNLTGTTHSIFGAKSELLLYVVYLVLFICCARGLF